MDLQACPPPEADLNVKAGQGGKDDDNGPGWIDSVTVGQYAAWMAGEEPVLRFPPWLADSVDAAVAAASLDEMTTLFQQKLNESFLDGSPTILLRRVRALHMTCMEVTENYKGGASPLGGVLVPNAINLLLARNDLESYVQKMVHRYEQEIPEELIRRMVMVTPKQLADMSGLTENQWAVWRNRNVGPRYLKPSRQTVRYPAVAVLKWIDDTLPKQSD